MNTEEKDKLTFGKKVKYSFYSAILFSFYHHLHYINLYKMVMVIN